MHGSENKRIIDHIQKILPVTAFHQWLCDFFQLVTADVVHTVGYFFDTADLQALAVFDHFNKLGSLEQGFEGAGIQPGNATAQHDDWGESPPPALTGPVRGNTGLHR